jgi:hypothetical protein
MTSIMERVAREDGVTAPDGFVERVKAETLAAFEEEKTRPSNSGSSPVSESERRSRTGSLLEATQNGSGDARRLRGGAGRHGRDRRGTGAPEPAVLRRLQQRPPRPRGRRAP